jgi:hypothetical protein
VEMKSDSKDKKRRKKKGEGRRGEDYWIWQLIIHGTLNFEWNIYTAETRDGPIWSFRLWLRFRQHHQQQTNKQQLLLPYVKYRIKYWRATNATVQDWQQFPNWCYCPGLATVPQLVLLSRIGSSSPNWVTGSRCDTYGGGADNNNNILALNQRLLQ